LHGNANHEMEYVCQCQDIRGMYRCVDGLRIIVVGFSGLKR
jgi:hypothetical protein